MDKEIREQIAEFQMGMRYYSRGVPRKIPAGMVICHNSVIPDRPDQPHGENGFRVWKANYEWLARHPQFKVCGCGWAPHLREHYSGLHSQP